MCRQRAASLEPGSKARKSFRGFYVSKAQILTYLNVPVTAKDLTAHVNIRENLRILSKYRNILAHIDGCSMPSCCAIRCDLSGL
jgi:hypothetical protein